MWSSLTINFSILQNLIVQNKKTKKVNSEKFVRYHEIIHHINSLKNNSKENIDEDNFKLEIESEQLSFKILK